MKLRVRCALGLRPTGWPHLRGTPYEQRARLPEHAPRRQDGEEYHLDERDAVARRLVTFGDAPRAAVVGAGLVGLVVGRRLAHLGYDVTVFDKERDLATATSCLAIAEHVTAQMAGR